MVVGFRYGEEETGEAGIEGHVYVLGAEPRVTPSRSPWKFGVVDVVPTSTLKNRELIVLKTQIRWWCVFGLADRNPVSRNFGAT